MRQPDLNESLNLTNIVLSSLTQIVQGFSSVVGAQTVLLCGQLSANAAQELSMVPGDLKFFNDLAACFDAAQSTGVTFELIDVVRTRAESMSPVSFGGIAVQNFSIRMSLVEQSKILASTTFVSRQDIDRYFDKINSSFQDAEETAANSFDNVAYANLLSLHAAVSNDLSSRSRPLPRMVTYSYSVSMPAIWIAQNLYQDPSRDLQLIAENKVIHPLFMPTVGRALAV